MEEWQTFFFFFYYKFKKTQLWFQYEMRWNYFGAFSFLSISKLNSLIICKRFYNENAKHFWFYCSIVAWGSGESVFTEQLQITTSCQIQKNADKNVSQNVGLKRMKTKMSVWNEDNLIGINTISKEKKEKRNWWSNVALSWKWASFLPSAGWLIYKFGWNSTCD